MEIKKRAPKSARTTCCQKGITKWIMKTVTTTIASPTLNNHTLVLSSRLNDSKRDCIFKSNMLFNAYSSFSVFFDSNSYPVHKEVTPLLYCDAPPHANCSYFYTCTFVPQYWPTICTSGESYIYIFESSKGCLDAG